MKEYPWGKGTPTWVRDATLNDSDKSFTVPAGKVWVLSQVMATLVATATAGNRVLTAMITNGTNAVHTSKPTGNIAASGSGTLCLSTTFSVSTAPHRRISDDAVSASAVGLSDSLPYPCVLPAGYVVRVWDVAAIDAAADDLTVVLHYVEYDA